MLGDRWGNEVEQPAPAYTVDYLRQKALEFQGLMNALDQAYGAANDALASQSIDMDTAEYLSQWIADFLAKRDQFRLTAEAINAGSAAVNAVGGRFPVLSIPQTLGIAPLVLPVAMVAALGAVAGLIYWGSQAISGLNDRLKRAQLLEAASPQQKAQLVQSIADSDAAVQQVQSSVLASVAPIAKWIALGVGAWLLYRAYQNR